jgi:hypothetical protein
MHAERQAKSLLGHAQRDQRVARRGPHAFADAVEQNEAGDATQRPADGEQANPADRRQRVARSSYLFVACPTIGR